jgi:DNA-binding GntR family transcriptional regulator
MPPALAWKLQSGRIKLAMNQKTRRISAATAAVPRAAIARGAASGRARNTHETESSTRDRVYDFIRHVILTGEYQGGTFIEEEDISARIGVSRTPVREAFHRLNAEQYIDLLPRKGALVRQVSPQELAGIYQARLMIEGSVMELICRERIPVPPEIPDIIERIRDTRSDTPDGRLAFIELDWSLHCAIVEMCGNDVLTEMYKSIRSRFDRVVRTIVMTQDHVKKVNKEHVAICKLLQAHDADQLRITLKEHLTL